MAGHKEYKVQEGSNAGCVVICAETPGSDVQGWDAASIQESSGHLPKAQHGRKE